MIARIKPKDADEWAFFELIRRSKGGRSWMKRVLTATNEALLSAQGEDVLRQQGAAQVIHAIAEAVERAETEAQKHG